MSNPLSDNTSPNPDVAERAAIAARLDHYHRLASLHHALITQLNEPDGHRFARGEFLQATAESIAETTRSSELDPATRFAVSEALQFYPLEHRDLWLARNSGDLLGEWEALSTETVPGIAPPETVTPDVADQAALEKARALQRRLFELYDIENAPDVVNTEDGPEYVLLDSEPDPKLAESIAIADKQLDHLRVYRSQLENVPEFAVYYAEHDYLRLKNTPPELHEHTVSIGYFDKASPFARGWPPGPQGQAPDLASAYTLAADTITHFAEPNQQIRLRISREIAAPRRAVTSETVHFFTGTATDVVSNLIAIREQDADPEPGEVQGVIGNRIRLRQRDPQAHPDREVVVGWDRSTDSFFAQVIDGTDPNGEDVLTINVGADTIREITEPHQVIDIVRPYAAIPNGLLDRLNNQRNGQARRTTQSEPAHSTEHPAEPSERAPDTDRAGERIGRLLDSAASTESSPSPSASSPPTDSPDSAATAGVLDAHEQHRREGYELA